MGKIYKNGIEYGGGGGSAAGGHTILDNDDNVMPTEDNLQFKGLDVTDNSTDGVTEVESAGLNQDSMDDVLSASASGTQVASNGMSYSTDEQVVGRWIDGKPLYQKTYTVARAANVGNTSITHGLSFDYITVADGVIIADDKSLTYPLPNNWVSTDGTDGIEQSGVFITPTTINIRVRNNEMTVPSTIYITVQYTKSTD